MKSYVEKFDLMKYIELNRTVTSLKVEESKSHRYSIKHIPTDLKEAGEIQEEFFDYVMI